MDKNRSLDGILDGNENSHFPASEPINSLSGTSANEEDCDDCDDCDDSKGNDSSPEPIRGSGVTPQPGLTVCTNCGLGISVGLTLYRFKPNTQTMWETADRTTMNLRSR